MSTLLFAAVMVLVIAGMLTIGWKLNELADRYGESAALVIVCVYSIAAAGAILATAARL